MEAIQLFTAALRYTDETTPVVPPGGREGELDETRGADAYTASLAADDVPAALRAAA